MADKTPAEREAEVAELMRRAVDPADDYDGSDEMARAIVDGERADNGRGDVEEVAP